MSDVDVDEGTELPAGDESADFMDFMGDSLEGADEDAFEQYEDPADEPSDDDDGEEQPGIAAARAGRKQVQEETEEEDEEEAPAPRAKGRERLAAKLAAKEREVTNLSRRLKELETKANGSNDGQAEPDFFDDRRGWMRHQIAKGLGLQTDHPRVAEELQELIDDAVFGDVSPEFLNDPKNEALKRQLEERKRTAQTRREQAALDRRLADIERREAEAAKAHQEAAVRSQLTGYMGQRADELPFLQANPDADPVDLVYQGLMLRWESGEDLSSAEAAQAAVRDITDRLEAHYSSVAERLAEVRERLRSATTRLRDDGAKRQDGAAKTKRRTGGATVTSAGGTGGRGAAPTKTPGTREEEETFDEFMQRGLSERTRTARRRR